MLDAGYRSLRPYLHSVNLPHVYKEKYLDRIEHTLYNRYASFKSNVNRAAKYTTGVVLAHLLVNIAHGLAHRELRVGLPRLGSVLVIVVVLLLPLVATAVVWTAKKRLGLILLSLSMFGSLLFGLYHHFLAAGPDHVHSQSASPWGITFAVTTATSAQCQRTTVRKDQRQRA